MSESPKTFEILQFPIDAKLLRRKARLVRAEEFDTPELLEFAAKLGQTMMAADGLGLASTQVAETPGGEPWAMFAMRVDSVRWMAICNPEILVATDERVREEGCLSFASVIEKLLAPELMMLCGRHPDGQDFEERLVGIQARCAFHENGHLAGSLLVDRMAPLKRTLFLRRMAKERRHGHA